MKGRGLETRVGAGVGSGRPGRGGDRGPHPHETPPPARVRVAGPHRAVHRVMRVAPRPSPSRTTFLPTSHSGWVTRPPYQVPVASPPSRQSVLHPLHAAASCIPPPRPLAPPPPRTTPSPPPRPPLPHDAFAPLRSVPRPRQPRSSPQAKAMRLPGPGPGPASPATTPRYRTLDQRACIRPDGPQ